MNTQTEAERLANALERDIYKAVGERPTQEAAAELRRLNFELQCANAAITARDKVFEANAELLEALRPFAVYGRPGSRDVEVAAAIAAITKHSKEQA